MHARRWWSSIGAFGVYVVATVGISALAEKCVCVQNVWYAPVFRDSANTTFADFGGKMWRVAVGTKFFRKAIETSSKSTLGRRKNDDFDICCAKLTKTSMMKSKHKHIPMPTKI
jgi:hypothetical protein